MSINDFVSNPRPGAGPSPGTMTMRPARQADHGQIIGFLKDLDLDYPARDLSRFTVGEVGGKILAIAELKDLGDLCLLSCVGVREELQGTGLGRALVNRVLRDVLKDVYLYTLVPDFFRKVGFEVAVSLPPSLPPRIIYGCASCDPAFCLCMVRKANGPTVSKI